MIIKNVRRIGLAIGITLMVIGFAIIVRASWILIKEWQYPTASVSDIIDEGIQSYTGLASWYDYDLWSGDKLLQYSKHNDTCASRDYKGGTILVVVRIDTGEIVKCRVNDYVENLGVIIDLSSHAFRQLAPLEKGLIPVKVWAE